MNAKIVLSVLSIFSALTLMGGATFALFSSTVSNNSNTFGSGSLTLNVNSLPGTTSSPVFNVTGAGPGSSTSAQVLDLFNSGSVNASATKLTSIDITPSPMPTPPISNLGKKSILELWDDVDNSSTINDGDRLINRTYLTSTSWKGLSLGFGLPAGGHHKIIAMITFDSTADDTYQNTSVSFNFNFEASQ